jgi:hypothetical protein
VEIIVVVLAVAAFLLFLVPASLLPLLAGAALGADTIDRADRFAAEPVVEPSWANDERVAA